MARRSDKRWRASGPLVKDENDEVIAECWGTDQPEHAAFIASAPELERERDALRAEVERQERRFREAETEWVERYERLEAENEHLKAEYAELNDLYYTIRGLVADGQDITVLIEQLRKQIADERVENERLKKDNELAANELVEYGKLIAKGGAEEERLRALMHRLWHQRKDMEVASIEFPRVSRDDLLAVRDELARANC